MRSSNFEQKERRNSNYYPLPKFLLDLRSFKSITKEVNDYFYYNNELVLYKAPRLKLISKQDESLEDFKIRVKDRLNEQYDENLEKLKVKFEKEKDRIESKLHTLQNRLEREKLDLKAKTTDTIISIGASIFGAFFGRTSSNIGKAASGARKVGRLSKEKNDVMMIEEDIADLNADIQVLQHSLQEHANALQEEYQIEDIAFEEVYIKPRRKDILDTKIMLLWEEV